MSNFERDMANTMLDAADARIASLEADKADLLRVLGVADEKIRSGEDARGQYIRENAALEARCRELERKVHLACNQFENITVAETLEIAKDRAHGGVAFTMETASKPAWDCACAERDCPYCGPRRATKGDVNG